MKCVIHYQDQFFKQSNAKFNKNTISKLIVKMPKLLWRIASIILGLIAPFISIRITHELTTLISIPLDNVTNIAQVSVFFFVYYLLCLAMHILFVKASKKLLKEKPSKVLVGFAIIWWTILITVPLLVLGLH